MTATGERGQPESPPIELGHPRIHLRRIDSTNEYARQLATAGAPHGTAVTADEQSAGRGRQGRSWLAPPRSALLCSLVLRDPPPLLSLIAGMAVCDVVGDTARVKWPNDIVLERSGAGEAPPTGAVSLRGAAAPLGAISPGGAIPPAKERHLPGADEEPAFLPKLAGILVEGRPQEGWAVLGVGLNVALRVEQLPPDVRRRAASLGLEPSAIEPTFERLLEALVTRLGEPIEVTLDAWRARDALYGRVVAWQAHEPQRRSERGRAQGIDEQGQLLVRHEDGTTTALSAGEVHLGSVG
ncbi:MAG TPA: biotin--[acetyl-CoA-carboxylase] ligase [Solirubrobacteraceae bacterium]|nr:biotin--[acetyl-CoA-carboxylase] ligase [Solirubrobacteraceae bacterium]